MSLQFNDTTTDKGIVQIYEKEAGFNRGEISGNTDKLRALTADVNLALDDFWAIAIQASGEWQIDDSNYTDGSGDYPIIKTNLVSGRRDYPFITDEYGNQILDIYKVLLADSNGTFHEIFPVDVQSQPGTEAFYDGTNASGMSYRYDKTANAIVLEFLPDYSISGGLKVYINREASYFASTDTTKKPGVPGILHKYFALKPAMDYVRIHGTSEAYTKIANEVTKMEQSIKTYFGRRNKDVRSVLQGIKNNFI